MRIESNRNSPKIGKKSAVKKTSNSSNFAPVTENDAPSAPTQTGSVASLNPIGAIDPMLMVDADAKKQQKQQALQDSHDVLDLLDDIKIGILSGVIPGGHIGKLSKLVDKTKVRFGDEQLDGYLEEVNLRAEVELAKLRKY